jgi:hypothetical protein
VANDLRHRARVCSERAWKWLACNLERFLPSDPSNPESMKQISELALLYAQLTQWLKTEQKTAVIEVEAVGTFLLDFFSRMDIIQFSRKRPSHYSAYIIPYLALRASGKYIAGYEDALIHLHRAGYPEACEKPPYRAMELQYARWKAGLSQQRPDWKANYHITTLGLCRNPTYLLKWEVYSITHTLFYLTDFSGPAPQMPPNESKRVGDLVEVLLVHYWRKIDWDIVGELLLNLVALNRDDKPLFALCASAFLTAWHNDGTMPGPTFIARTDEANEDYIFKHCYHTTLVGLLLCGAYLYRSACDEGDAKNNASA